MYRCKHQIFIFYDCNNKNVDTILLKNYINYFLLQLSAPLKNDSTYYIIIKENLYELHFKQFIINYIFILNFFNEFHKKIFIHIKNMMHKFKVKEILYIFDIIITYF